MFSYPIESCSDEDTSLIYSRQKENIQIDSVFNDSPCYHFQKNIQNYNIKTGDNSYNDDLVGRLAGSAWPMFCHNVKHTGLSPYSTSNNTYDEMWRIKTDRGADSGVIIDEDGLLYVADSDGTLYSIYPNGTIKWTYEVGDVSTSTPCIDNKGTIYCGSMNWYLSAIYPNGTRKWRTNLGGAISSSPAITDDGTIYVGTMSGNDSLVAVSPNGTIKWSYKTGDFITSDPAIADDGTIIFGSADTYIYALNPNGTLRWKYNTPHWVKGPASIDEQGIIYINCYDGYLYALFPNGTLKWKTDVEGFWGTETNPSFGPDGTIYIAADGVAAINPDDGGVVWIFEFLRGDGETYLSSPVVSADGTIYVGTMINDLEGGRIYAIDSLGGLIWSKILAETWIAATPSIGSDGTVYITSCWGHYGGAIHAFGQWNGTNHPPETPESTGEEQGSGNVLGNYELKIKGFDEDQHPMKYIIRWGDGTKTETIEAASDFQISQYHDYPLRCRYKIGVKAIDSLGLESDWIEYQAEITTSPSIFNFVKWIVLFFSNPFGII